MTYNRKDLAVQVDIKSIKGYTMREIGALEERIKRLEYYTVLNALELETRALSIKDDTGTLERFKNGIFADPFNDFTIGNKDDKEFRIAIQGSKSIARPLFEENIHSFKYSPSYSSNIKVSGHLAMLDYDHEYYGGNKYATSYRNCAEFFYKYNGSLTLYPNFDNRTVATTTDAQMVTIDLTKGFTDLIATGIAKNIDTVTNGSTISGSTTSDWNGGGSKTTNHWTETATKTITDIAVTTGTANLTQDVGTYVTNVASLPYMRSRLIACVARGMRPNTRLYVYFDKLAVSVMCAPAYVSPSYATNNRIDSTKMQSLIANGKENEVLVQNGSFGDPIISNAYGEAYFIFSLPENTFRGGDRTMILTNVDSVAAESAVITRTEAVYTSSSLSVTQNSLKFQIQQPKFTPTNVSTPVIVREWDTATYEEPPSAYIPYVPGDVGGFADGGWVASDSGNCGGDGGDGGGGGGCGDDPIAETFEIADLSSVSQPGIYLTQIGVFFKKKSPTLGIRCSIMGTNLGQPDRNQILGSVELLPQYVSVSDDSSVETLFTFNNPVLLQADKQYAFVLMPEGSNPDYEVWYSEIGGTDILTGTDINKQPFNGLMYISSNNRGWSAVQSSDIKFNMYRARFKYDTGTLSLRNDTEDYLTLSAYLRANTSNPVRVGDVVYAANTANTRQTFTDTSQYPFGIVEAVDELNGKLILEKTNGLFSNTTYPNLKIYRVSQVGNVAQITLSNLVANCTLGSIYDIQYHNIVPKFSVIEPSGTSIKMSYTGSSNSYYNYTKDNSSHIVKNESLYEFSDYERILRSYSNEVATNAANPNYYINGTGTAEIILKTSDPYLSPVVDLNARTMNFVKNIINTDLTNEHTRYGNALNKYVSKPVVLSQEAEDILVYITGYRPYSTDILVYAKFLNRNDTDSLESKTWTLMNNNSLGSYSSPQDREDYREYVYSMPISNNQLIAATSVPTAAFLDKESVDPLNVLTYYDTREEFYTGYNSFAIKIVLTGSNPVNIPTMRDVRAIALMR
jgi:hypothetical protein